MSEYTPRAQELARQIRAKALRNLERQGVVYRDVRTGQYIRRSNGEVLRGAAPPTDPER